MRNIKIAAAFSLILISATVLAAVHQRKPAGAGLCFRSRPSARGRAPGVRRLGMWSDQCGAAAALARRLLPRSA